MFQRPINITKVIPIKPSIYEKADFDRNNIQPVLELQTGIMKTPWHWQKLIITSQRGHSISGEPRQPGNLGTWQFGVRAFFAPLWTHMCVPTS